MTGRVLCWAAAAQVSYPGPESGPPQPLAPRLGKQGPSQVCATHRETPLRGEARADVGPRASACCLATRRDSSGFWKVTQLSQRVPATFPDVRANSKTCPLALTPRGFSPCTRLHSAGPFPSPMTGPGGPGPHTEWHRRPLPPVAPPTPAQCPGWFHLVAKSLPMQDLVPPEPPAAQSLGAAPSGWRRPPAGLGVATGKASGRSIPASSVTIPPAAFGQGPHGAGVLPARRRSEESRDAGQSRP